VEVEYILKRYQRKNGMIAAVFSDIHRESNSVEAVLKHVAKEGHWTYVYHDVVEWIRGQWPEEWQRRVTLEALFSRMAESGTLDVVDREEVPKVLRQQPGGNVRPNQSGQPSSRGAPDTEAAAFTIES
jgi:hypothetical protein